MPGSRYKASVPSLMAETINYRTGLGPLCRGVDSAGGAKLKGQHNPVTVVKSRALKSREGWGIGSGRP